MARIEGDSWHGQKPKQEELRKKKNTGVKKGGLPEEITSKHKKEQEQRLGETRSSEQVGLCGRLRMTEYGGKLEAQAAQVS